MGTTGVRHKRTVVSSFNMGLISPPIQYTLMQKIPSYAMIFYTFNTLAFSAGAMDSMLQMMMGTTDEALPIVMSPQMDAVFMFGFFIVMGCMFKTGIMGVSGAAQYGVMNAVFGCIALYNVKNL